MQGEPPSQDTLASQNKGVFSDVISAVSIAAIEASTAVSLAVLIFSGELTAGVPRATTNFLVGSVMVLLLIGARTSMRVVISGAQDAPAIVAAAIAATVVNEAAPEQRLATVVVVVALGGLLSGILFGFIGWRRLGEVARSIPFTVISGFMAGTGWLLLTGGIEVMTGLSTTLSNAGALLAWENVRYWLPGIALAFFVAIALDRGASSLLVGAATLLTGVGIHVVGQAGWSLAELQNEGWLIGPFPVSSRWAPIGPADLRDADWGVIFGQSLPLVGLAVISLIGLSLNVTGLEVAVSDDVDLDHELSVAGVANVASAAAGGTVGFHLFGLSSVANRLGAKGYRVPAIVGALILLVVVVAMVGGDPIGLIPRAVAGGMLAASGLGLLIDWARQVRRDLNRLDGVLSALVLVVIILFGVLTGIIAGVLAAAVMFVFSYSRVSPIRQFSTMATMQSNVDRPVSERQFLANHAAEVVALELSGYLFFGSIRQITSVVRPMIDDEALRYLVLDFRGVRGVDASVVTGFESLERRAAASGVTIVWSHVHHDLAAQLLEGGGRDRLREADLDRALEFVEEKLLASVELEVLAASEEAWVRDIRAHGQRLELEAGDTLIDATDETQRMFIILEGKLTAWGETGSGGWIRYRQVGPGSFLGEVSFVTGAHRTATVRADTDAVVIALSPDDLAELAAVDPDLVARTLQIIARRLAERLDDTSRTVRNQNN